MDELRLRARRLRLTPTDAERLLWSRIRMRALCGYKFRRRTRRIEAKGYRVLRFWNNDVMAQLDVVLGVILRACDEKR